MKSSDSSAGYIYMSLIALLIVGAVGAVCTLRILPVIGFEAFQQNGRWISGAATLLLAPLWLLYSDLKKIRDRDDLSNIEGREIRFKTQRAIRTLLICAGFMMTSGIFWFTTGLWPTNNEIAFRALAAIAGAFLCIQGSIAVNALYNIFEANKFEAMLAARKLRATQSKKLLDQFKTN